MNFYKVRVSYKKIKRKKDYQEYEVSVKDEDNNITTETEYRPILIEEISEDPPYKENVLISAASQEHALTVLRQEYCLEVTSTDPEDYETYFDTVGRLLVSPTDPEDITIVKNLETGDPEDENLLNMIFIQKNGAVINVL